MGATKPPLGIIPEAIAKEHRLNDLIEAIKRYNEANMPIPPEWDSEASELKRWLSMDEMKRGGLIESIWIEPMSVIKKQDEIIGRLTRENAYLSDSAIKRNEWLHKAKRDAGYSNNTPFDEIWKKALELLLKDKKPSNV